MGITAFSPLCLSKGQGRLQGAFEGPEVASWRPGQGGDRAARPEGLSPAWARSFLLDHRLCPLPRAHPGVLRTALPRGPFPPAGNRPSPAGAAGQPRPWPPQPPQPGLPRQLPPRPSLPGDRGQHRATRSGPRAQRSCSSGGAGDPGSGCSGLATPTPPRRRKSRERALPL